MRRWKRRVRNGEPINLRPGIVAKHQRRDNYYEFEIFFYLFHDNFFRL